MKVHGCFFEEINSRTPDALQSLAFVKRLRAVDGRLDGDGTAMWQCNVKDPSFMAAGKKTVFAGRSIEDLSVDPLTDHIFVSAWASRN